VHNRLGRAACSRCARQWKASAIDAADNFASNFRYRENAVGESGLGYKTGHSPDNGASLILRDHLSESFFDLFTATQPILAHAGHDDGEHVLSANVGYGAEEDID